MGLHMKIKHLSFLAVLLAVFFLTGCSSTGDEEGTGSGDGAEVINGNGDGSDAETSGANSDGDWTGNPLDNPNSLLSTKVIYFDFDLSTLRDEYIDVLRKHADYLIANPDAVLTLEGHCDERGSREYNVALGERRGNAVQAFLQAQGVGNNQLTIISYGEERPNALGHDEESWALNRRVELVY